MKSALKQISPLVAVVAAIFAVGPNPSQFGVSTATLGFVSLAALVLCIGFVFSEKRRS